MDGHLSYLGTTLARASLKWRCSPQSVGSLSGSYQVLESSSGRVLLSGGVEEPSSDEEE
ncbi:hypothetical protein CONPUDRAFT_146782, partial [Coniophora puteana RWD-64-598 SS2]